MNKTNESVVGPSLGAIPKLAFLLAAIAVAMMATWFLASWPWLVAMGIGLAILGFTLGGWVWVRP